MQSVRRAWQGIKAPRNLPSPFRVANRLHVDCDPIVDRNGLIPSNMFSVALCLQVANFSPDGRALSNVRASLVNQWGNHADLIVRCFGSRVDLAAGAIGLVEIGRVLVTPSSGSAPARIRDGGWRHELSSVDIAIAANQEGERRSLMVSGNQKMRFAELRGARAGAAFRVVISAEHAPPFRIALRTNLWADSPYAWLSRVRATSATDASDPLALGSSMVFAPTG